MNTGGNIILTIRQSWNILCFVFGAELSKMPTFLSKISNYTKDKSINILTSGLKNELQNYFMAMNLNLIIILWNGNRIRKAIEIYGFLFNAKIWHNCLTCKNIICYNVINNIKRRLYEKTNLWYWWTVVFRI